MAVLGELLRRATIDKVRLLTTSAKGAALLLEFVHGDGRQCRGGMVLSGVVVDLMDGLGCVHDVRLDRLCGDLLVLHYSVEGVRRSPLWTIGWMFSWMW